VRYELAIARPSGDVSATGWFVHVFVDRETRRPVDIPERLRGALAGLQVEAEA
jgi:acyl-CoA thioester hydrolase